MPPESNTTLADVMPILAQTFVSLNFGFCLRLIPLWLNPRQSRLVVDTSLDNKHSTNVIVQNNVDNNKQTLRSVLTVSELT